HHRRRRHVLNGNPDEQERTAPDDRRGRRTAALLSGSPSSPLTTGHRPGLYPARSAPTRPIRPPSLYRSTSRTVPTLGTRLTAAPSLAAIQPRPTKFRRAGHRLPLEQGG